ncbi:holin [Rhodococcus phage Whack]|uniref:Holin n=1 Tax=Rhodococcus phage Whack TaxID=2591132 RepID=A0A515MK79_9CAUD|nr:holin [Rhodococcus phage Whack]QDM57085.1 holin [Rhodococcus phage Whack]
MIEKFAAAWPALRKTIYILLAAGLAVAFTYGKVDAAQQASILESASQVLGFVGFVLAALYTPKGGRIIGDKTDVPVEYNVIATAPSPSITIPLPSAEQITSVAGPTIAELRARVEQTLGRRSGD